MSVWELTKKKKKLDQYRPLPAALVRNLYEWFRIELTYSSNAIEGNTLTRRETALVVEKGLTIGGKSLIEHLEARNHAGSVDWIIEKVKHKSQITERELIYLHEMILKGIDDDNAGRYRNVPVRISGSRVVLPNPRKVPGLMEDFVAWLRKPNNVHPVEFAAEVHYRLVTIHPFIDGNGRTARLLMNLILLQEGYPFAIIRKRDRLAYIGSLEKAQAGGSKDDYVNLIIKAVDRSLNIYLKAVKGETDPQPADDILLKIGDLARKVGEPNSTIRHWTKEGLLTVAEFTESGYQLYDSKMVERINEIRRLKEKRHTLQEIKDLLGKL